jgi:putative transposase
MLASLLYRLFKLSRALQLPLPARPTWGGARPGAGRKPMPGRRPDVPHRPRPAHHAAHPVHVTLRTVAAVRCLRAGHVFPDVRRAIAAASGADFRIVEYSVQRNHLHLLVEAAHRRALSSGLRGLAIRIARAVNRARGRRGRLWGGRYHARALTSPRAVRHALVYVLMNFKKHLGPVTGLDPCSSATWFTGWRSSRPVAAPDPLPVARPRTWLAGAGWRRHGRIGLDERPRG